MWKIIWIYHMIYLKLGIFHLWNSGCLNQITPFPSAAFYRPPSPWRPHLPWRHRQHRQLCWDSARAKEQNGERVGWIFWGSVEWGWSKFSLDEMDGFLGWLNGRFSKMEDMLLLFWRSRCLLFQDMNHVEISCWGWREILYLGHLVVFWQNRHCLQNIYQPTQPRFSKIWIDHCPKLPMHLN